jgi:hypothetical protein
VTQHYPLAFRGATLYKGVIETDRPEGNAQMIYPTKASAQEVADMINRVYNYGGYESRPVMCEHGWTVITKAVWG